MATLEGKHFSITDPKDVNTVIYKINETEKEFQKDSPKFTVERLDSTSEIRGENTKRTYFVDIPSPEYDQLVILSFGKDKVVVNSGILEGDKVKISKQPSFLKFDTLYSEETQYKELYIGAGETLWSIAKVELKENPYYFNKDIREIISDIKHRNELNTSALYIGQKLLIPCM